MSGEGWPLITLEIVLGFGVPLAWGVWQLIDLRRYREKDAAERLARQARPPAPPSGQPTDPVPPPSPGDAPAAAPSNDLGALPDAPTRASRGTRPGH